MFHDAGAAPARCAQSLSVICSLMLSVCVRIFVASSLADCGTGTRTHARTLTHARRCPSGDVAAVMQVPTVVDCTGGVVWETAYALAGWLTAGPPHARIVPAATTMAPQVDRSQSKSIGRKQTRRPAVLELGAGCGLLGAVLARCGCDVLVTEVDQALPYLESNVASNAPPPPGWLKCTRLLWGNAADIATALSMGGVEVALHGGFDHIVATDVIFAVSLVDPLLRTMHACLAHHGSVHVCVQVRCADAHAAFLDRASLYFADVCTLTPELARCESTAFAASCDCELFRLGRKRPKKRLPSVQ